MDKIIGLKDLRENLPAYAEKINHGACFVVVKKSKPLFRICPVGEDESLWEDVVDFTKIKKGGVDIKELLNRL
jgi:antitoxin (DNA-binding transcriptional repressor) of toxin-antitoxin stability system